jgi:prophage tail gpP-like protein
LSGYRVAIARASCGHRAAIVLVIRAFALQQTAQRIETRANRNAGESKRGRIETRANRQVDE